MPPLPLREIGVAFLVGVLAVTMIRKWSKRNEERELLRLQHLAERDNQQRAWRE